MKVLMQNRYDALTKKGGDSYQMLYTKEYLEKEGISVDISTELKPDLHGYDLIHLYNITRVHETYVQFANAQKMGKKIVVSPIYHSIKDITNYENKNLSGLHNFFIKALKTTDKKQLLKTFYYIYKYPKIYYSWYLQLIIGYTQQQKRILENSDLIIPNTKMEIEAIQLELFNNKRINTKYTVIFNGINKVIYKESKKIITYLQANKINEYVLCPGRIEPRKNQLRIINAIKNSLIPVLFVGRMTKMHYSYSKEFIKLVNESKNIFYLEEVNQEDMMTLYNHAKVAITASWFETTGLVGLEAGSMGCNVVMTEKGYTKEYYKDHVWYCNPENTFSIQNAIISSYKAKKGGKKLSDYINKMNYTWKNAAKETLEAYKNLLN
jgi:glycosyltransferase involved in cell wall biosynthesis